MTNSIVTGHSAEIAAVTTETDAIKAEWDAMTHEQQEARKSVSREKFERDCESVGHVPFWS